MDTALQDTATSDTANSSGHEDSGRESSEHQSSEHHSSEHRDSEHRDWEVVIGLEVHAQLRTRAKLFSAAPNAFGAEPNSVTREVDLGMPGVLPVLNGRAVELALRAALALGCSIQPLSRFARKHYFYPDLPKGYQISQYEEPYALGGAVPIELDGALREVPLTRIHMEEDAGKSIHDDAITGLGVSHVDLNRAGVPLIEIVSEPALRSAEEAGAYLRSLRSILRYVEVSDADMEKGQFRCDVNVSIRRPGDPELGVKVELKNLNSFRSVERALEHEIARQIELQRSGQRILQETRHWDERANCTRPGREKEDADDYRYFPDPDLIPLRIAAAQIDELRKQLPELPLDKRARYQREWGLAAAAAQLISEDRELAEFYEAVVALGAAAAVAANWVTRELLELLAGGGREVSSLPFGPGDFAKLLDLVESRRATPAAARTILLEMAESGADPEAIMRDRGLESVSDRGELESVVQAVIEGHAEQVAQYRAGEGKVLNFLLGQVMRRTQGKADPAVAREVLVRLLE